MIIPVKKTLNNTGNIDAKLIDFSEICLKKIQRNRLFFTDYFLAKFPPGNFPSNRPIFLRICSWKSFQIWLFSAKIPQNRRIFLLILPFLPQKSHEFWLSSHEIGRFFHKFWIFPAKSADFSVNLPLKIPRNFAFFPQNTRSPDKCMVTKQLNKCKMRKSMAKVNDVGNNLQCHCLNCKCHIHLGGKIYPSHR